MSREIFEDTLIISIDGSEYDFDLEIEFEYYPGEKPVYFPAEWASPGTGAQADLFKATAYETNQEPERSVMRRRTGKCWDVTENIRFLWEPMQLEEKCIRSAMDDEECAAATEADYRRDMRRGD